jgi:hypothetical protein
MVREVAHKQDERSDESLPNLSLQPHRQHQRRVPRMRDGGKGDSVIDLLILTGTTLMIAFGAVAAFGDGEFMGGLILAALAAACGCIAANEARHNRPEPRGFDVITPQPDQQERK